MFRGTDLCTPKLVPGAAHTPHVSRSLAKAEALGDIFEERNLSQAQE